VVCLQRDYQAKGHGHPDADLQSADQDRCRGQACGGTHCEFGEVQSHALQQLQIFEGVLPLEGGARQRGRLFDTFISKIQNRKPLSKSISLLTAQVKLENSFIY